MVLHGIDQKKNEFKSQFGFIQFFKLTSGQTKAF